MPLRRLKLITTAEHAAQRLDDVLSQWLTSVLERTVSKSKVRKLIVIRAIRLSGSPVSIASQSVSPRTKIEADIDVEKLFGDATSRDKPFELTEGRILFEDADLLAVEKPPGLPSQPTLDAARDNLFAAVGRFLQRRDGITAYVGVHQRLDRDTSGVVLFTKSKRVNAAVAEIFSKHLGIKSYQALTGPRPKTGSRKQDWTIKNYLGRISTRSKRSMYGAVGSEGDFAETSFRVLAEYPRGLWIGATPKTGRTHQIRVHLSEMGLPILGDDLYGTGDRSPGPFRMAPRLMLHATELVFPHPITGRETSVRSPLPEDFAKCLRRIRASG